MSSRRGSGGEAAGGSSKPPKASGSRGINVLLGEHPREFDSDDGDDSGSGGADFMRKVATNLLGVAPGDLGEPKGKVDDTQLLRRLIAAVTREQKNEQWVEAHGVPGFAAPSDERREPLHIGKISAALGIKLSPDIPKSVDAYVGPLCPCAHLKGIPAENWYYSPRSEEFKSGKPEYTRQPTAEVTKFGYYHKLGKCRRMREEAHKLGRKDPANIALLTPLPRGCPDCISL